MILKKIIFYFYLTIALFFFTPVLSKTIDCSNYFLAKNFQDPKNLERINIEIYDARKWYINFARIVSDRRNQIRKNSRKNF